MVKYDREISLAVDIGYQAIKITENLRQNISKYYQKLDETPVSIADLAAQIYIIWQIKTHFPFDQIIAEEANVELLDESAIELIEKTFSLLNIKDITDLREILLYRGNNSDRQWTVDPIDGTKGYQTGGYYAIGIGMMVKSIPKVAMIAIPPLDHHKSMIFKAIQNEGAWSSPDRKTFKEIKVGSQNKLSKSKICHSLHFDLPLTEKFMKEAGIQDSVAMDSMIKFCEVAKGNCDIYFRPTSRGINAWDIVPGDLLVREAGGIVTDFKGNLLRYDGNKLKLTTPGFIATNKYLHPKILNILKEKFYIDK
ncbi:MAG: hypothetical protein EU543_00390 [Promethearchaeota archaeon]|nr:MAG: hypothetical protein EU543_00390 [Candidatus Lokiarchaeota archaeon]